MKKLLRRRITIFFILLIPILIISTSSIIAAEKSNKSILVDFEAGIVGDVKLRGNISNIIQAIGSSRVKETTEFFEGQPEKVYIILFGNHKVYKRSKYFFYYKDPTFKTKEGLGIGSKVRDFNRHYGDGRILFDEGFSIKYETDKIHISVLTKYIETFRKGQNIKLYTNSKVNEVCVW